MLTFTGGSGATGALDPDAQIGETRGMGQVFRGVDSVGTPVAVKRVTLRLGSEEERRRREREVEVTAALAAMPTPHVLATLDVGRVGEDLMIVMPLARRSLEAALRAGD